MDSKHWPRNFGFGLLFLLAGTAGCQDPAHRERVEMRENNLRETTGMLVEMEASRSETMRRTLDMLRDWYNSDLVKCRRAAADAEQWMHDDLTQWQRNEKYNRELLEDLGRGNVQEIEETIPLILY